MSNRVSHRTKPIAIRLPIAVYDTIARKARKQGMKPSEWLRRRTIYDVCRKHSKP